MNSNTLAMLRAEGVWSGQYAHAQRYARHGRDETVVLITPTADRGDDTKGHVLFEGTNQTLMNVRLATVAATLSCLGYEAPYDQPFEFHLI